MVERKHAFQIFANLFLALLAALCILPFLLLFSSSLTSEHDLIRDGYGFFPLHIDLAAYRYILIDTDSILRGYMISFFVTFVGTLCNLTITTLFAYPLSIRELPGRRALSFFLFFTMLFNGGLIPTYIMWTQLFHIKNTIAALLVPNLLMGAFYVIMMRTYFTNSIPVETLDAARIDGAGEARILRSIVIPMSKPIISTLSLLVGLNYWNDWVNGMYYINDDKYYSIQLLLNRMLMDTQFMMQNTNNKYGNIDTSQLPSTGIKMAVAVMGVLPILIIYPFLQKYLVKGITIGAVKG